MNNFIHISSMIDNIIEDVRYYGDYNFVGKRINGYNKPYLLLTKETVVALKKANEEFNVMGYRIKIYDAYRPQKAVNQFVEWAKDDNNAMKDYFYPGYSKQELFDLGYVCKQSGHTRGSTLDLTLVDEHGCDLDMGTTFDYFGVLSHPDTKEGLTDKQYQNRMLLRGVMLKHGFKPFPTEWWHFTLENEPYPDTYFDFDIA